MAVDIDTLQIEVEAESSKAADNVNKLADALERLKKNASSNNLGSTVKQIQEIGNSAGTSSKINQKKQILDNAKQTIDASGEQQVDGTTEKVNLLQSAFERARAGASSLGQTIKDTLFNKETKGIESAKDAVQKFSASIEKWKNAIGRIAFYRTIRSAISTVAQGFREGISNLYQYSKLVGTEFAPAMDSLATDAQYLKNSLGTIAAPLLQAVAPAVEYLIGKFVDLINVVARVLAVLSGKSTYSKAIRQVTEYAAATGGAAEAAQRFLMGIDEITKLESASSGGSAAPGYGAMFEETGVGDVSSFLITLKDVLFKWDEFTPELVAEKVLTAVFGVAGAIIGWQLGGATGALIGLTLGAALGIFISDVIFDGDGSLSSEEIAKLVLMAVFGVSGGIIGWSIGGVAGAAIGLIVGASLSVLLTSIFFNNDNELSNEEIAGLCISAILGTAGGIIGFFVGGPAGAAVGLTIGASLGISLKGIIFNNDGEISTDEILTGLTFALGAIGGGVIGFSVGGPAGAVIGVTVGLGAALFLKGIDVNGDGEWSSDELLSAIAKALGAISGGVIGFAVGGPLGAAIGASIGLGVSLLVSWLTEPKEDGKSLVEGFFEGIEEKMHNVGAWLREHISDPLINGVKDLLGIHSPSTVFAEIGEYLVEGLLSGISDTWNTIVDFFGEKIEGIKQTCSDAWSSVKETATEKWESIKTTLGDTWDNIKETASTKFDEVKEKISKIWDDTKTDAKTWGSDVCSNIASGIRGAISTVTSAASTVASKIKEYIGFSEPERGPLSNFHTYMPDMLELMAKGIKENIPLAVNAISALASSLSSEFESMTYSASVASLPSYETTYANLGGVMAGTQDVDGTDNGNDAAGFFSGMRQSNEDITNVILAGVQQIVTAINNSGGALYLDSWKVGEITTSIQNRQNRIYGKTRQNV